MRLIPDGEYDFTVAKAEEQKSKAGDPMLKVTLQVFMEDGSARLLDDFIMLTPNWAWKLRHFAESLNMIAQYDRGDFQPETMIGASGWIKVGKRKRKDTGDDQNCVRDYLSEETDTPDKPAEKPKSPAQVGSQMEPAPIVEDDVPF